MTDSDRPDAHDAAPGAPKEESAAREMAARQAKARDLETTIFTGVQGPSGGPGGGPVEPVRLTPSDSFQFRCHRGVACWNVCCHGADVTLTPCDILILAKHFMLRPAKFVAEYTVPAIHQGSGLPVAKLLMTDSKDPGDGPSGGPSGDLGDGKGPCVFMDEAAGCTVYGDRPVTCRYYPLGLGAIKMKGHESREDMYFLVKEAHCKGHFEDHEQTVAEFRQEQGVAPYDSINERWIDILMQMASWRSLGGPMGRDVSKQTKRMFYMISTDVDAFRRFVFETKFLDSYDIDADMADAVRVGDEALLQLGFDWLRNVMFNEPTITLKQEVLQDAIGKAREGLGGA